MTTEPPEVDDILKYIRDRAGDPRGLLPGRAPRFKIISGTLILALGIVATLAGHLRSTTGNADLVALGALVGGVLAMAAGTLLCQDAVAKGTHHRVLRAMNRIMTAVSWTSGAIGALLTAFSIVLLGTGLVQNVRFFSDYPSAARTLLIAQLLALMLALLCILDLNPIVSSDLRPGARASLMRVRLAVANTAGVGLGLVVLVRESHVLGELVPTAIAATIVTTAVLTVTRFRRRVDDMQRHGAEYFGDVLLAANALGRTTTSSSKIAIDLEVSLSRLETFLAPVNDTGRIGIAHRSDEETIGLVKYLLGRIRGSVDADPDGRFVPLEDLDERAFARSVEVLALSYRSSLLYPSANRRKLRPERSDT